ncbi:leukocyte receptor cluster member 1 homolog [Dreissena polymorpha]|uniref:CBF1-interacting co-repressor CIR N-terminal domain-containing protein n=1 Tax=Dreissena polymorpha TaxID=45954 RepID=A0A9D4MXP3_DREPO|nr:leukocyte receptor cluster member 1 homolog [Dreissena polymorpha]KAH3883077.1 hypothetical protein DPMN_007025 [Dreissena polymorpha]
MNILPHKSWHVRTKKNIERVRRDEAQAAEEEKERQRKIALAEQEARTDLLRKRSRIRTEGEIEHDTDKVQKLDSEAESAVPSSSVDIYTPQGHINFFKDIEAGDVKQGTNKEYEKEKKEEKEKWEKDIGLLNYLGQNSVEKQEDRPWYLSKRKELNAEEKFDAKDRKLKNSLDPLHQMSSYLSTKHKHSEKEKDRKSSHKLKSKHKEKNSHDKKVAKPSASKSIEQLRAERLKREQEERQRVRELFSGESSKVKEANEPMNERDRGYNSVYNPDLVRRKKPRHSHDYEKY